MSQSTDRIGERRNDAFQIDDNVWLPSCLGNELRFPLEIAAVKNQWQLANQVHGHSHGPVDALHEVEWVVLMSLINRWKSTV